MNRLTLAALSLLWPVVASATSNVIPDGDFELGVTSMTDHWHTSTTQRPGPVITWFFTTHVAMLGAANNELTIVEHNDIRLDYDMVELEMSTVIQSTEPCGYGFDSAVIEAWTSSGDYNRVELDLCTDNAGYALLTLPLVGYSGDDLFIRMVAETDVTVPSTLTVDDVTTN